MENDIISVSNSYNCLFASEEDKKFFENLLYYVLTDKKPVSTPALWQDVEILMRYLKRDVWSVSNEQRDNAENAMKVYRLKYFLEHLKKAEILSIIKEFLAQDRFSKEKTLLLEFFNKKFLARVDDLILTHEKIMVTKDMICDFDKLFEYPAWLEFDKEAIKECFDKIRKNKFTDEQISYFLGANDDMERYDKWFEVAKHVLLTTNNSQTFWIAGDILNIVWKAVPDDEKLQKWFYDQIFEIFWQRVGKSSWVLKNAENINFDANEETKIAYDAMGWLKSLPDLKERIEDLPKDFELNIMSREDEEEIFNKKVAELLAKNDADRAAYAGIDESFFELTDLAFSDEHIKILRDVVKNDLVPEVKRFVKDTTEYEAKLNKAIEHAEKYIASQKRERKVMEKYIEKQMKK